MRTEAKRQQWKLRHALGYTIAMRGYLKCWRGLLVAAGVTNHQFQMLDALLWDSRALEKDLRNRLQNIPKTVVQKTKESKI